MILILDFGSQFTQLIARRIRELNVYCEIHPYNIFGSVDKIPKPLTSPVSSKEIKGIILSGGPVSVYDENPPKISKSILTSGVPVLGICYGMQLICFLLGGKVGLAKIREHGCKKLKVINKAEIFYNLPDEFTVWMSHKDEVISLPKGFLNLASTEICKHAAIADMENKIYGVQFHPEVKNTEFGKEILKNFVLRVCKVGQDWTMKNYLAETISEIKSVVGKEKVISALSGGVDSSVTATLLHRAIGDQLTCVFVDTGLLRAGEPERVKTTFGRLFGKQLKFIPAKKRFLKALKGVTAPEKKRKIIGREYIRIFEEVARSIGDVKFLAQGTLYPDVIESGSSKGPSAKIKTHHNVGGLPARMKLKLIEPLKYLFKDEVRLLGKELGLPDEIVYQQPFPGPGLAVRVIGEVNERRLNVLRQANKIVEEEIKNALGTDAFKNIWQAFAILLPVKTVGIMGEKRTYENVIALRVVESTDAMTANWVDLPYELLNRISNRIINEVKGVNRVVYDISSKPPATIEWE